MHAPDHHLPRLDKAVTDLLDAFALAEVSSEDTNSRAAKALAEIAALSPFQARAVQRAVRAAYAYAPYRRRSPGPLARAMTRVKAPVAAPSPSQAVFWLRLMHPDGHVREAAVRALEAPPANAISLAVLLLVLDDHVPEVRRAAGDTLLCLIEAIETNVIAEALPFLALSRERQRRAEMAEAVERLIGKPEVQLAAGRMLMEATDGWLPRVFLALLASDVVDAHLPALAEGARHPAIRARAIRLLGEGRFDRLPPHRALWRDPLRNPTRPVPAPVDLPELIAATARDRRVAVRKAAAEALVRHFRHLPGLDNLLAAFDRERNTAILARLDFIRRQTGAG
jgi:hypothetical protein